MRQFFRMFERWMFTGVGGAVVVVSGMVVTCGYSYSICMDGACIGCFYESLSCDSDFLEF